MHGVVFDIFGLKMESEQGNDKLDGLMQILLAQRADAKARKDFAASDRLRDQLLALGITIKDGKEGATYNL